VGVPAGPAQAQLSALDAAVADVDAKRGALLAAPEVVVAAATALDAADEACATGDRELAGRARRDARAEVGRVDAALGGYAGQLAAYRGALEALGPAAGPLEPRQRGALAALAAVGEQEAAALSVFGEAARAAWPAYAALRQVQSTWLDRASAGWYRSRSEAAGGYAVLRGPAADRLGPARQALAQADAARRPLTERMRSALAEANAALAGLRTPTGAAANPG
jgi:hypothetical protein